MTGGCNKPSGCSEEWNFTGVSKKSVFAKKQRVVDENKRRTSSIHSSDLASQACGDSPILHPVEIVDKRDPRGELQKLVADTYQKTFGPEQSDEVRTINGLFAALEETPTLQDIETLDAALMVHQVPAKQPAAI